MHHLHSRALGPRTLSALAAAAMALSHASPSSAKPPIADPELPSYQPAAGLKGELLISRLEPTEGFVAAWVRDFSRIYPDVKIGQTSRSTTIANDCYNELLAGKVQVAPFVREVQKAELDRGIQALGYEPLILAIATGSYAMNGNSHALAIYVNADNPLDKLTMTQLDAIFSTTRLRGYPSDLATWGQLGLTGDWADKPIHAYAMVSYRADTPNSIPGVSYFFLLRTLLQGGKYKANITEMPDHPVPGKTTALGRKNNLIFADLVRAVTNDRYGIAYSAYPELVREVMKVGGDRDYAHALDGAKTLKIAETSDGPYYAGTPEDVLDRHYPLTRKIYMIVNTPLGRAPSPALREFIRFVLSREGQQAVADDAQKFLPLTAPVAVEERARARVD